jgi:cyclophilin family peptidyl-prolyl cis-trans isomerase
MQNAPKLIAIAGIYLLLWVSFTGCNRGGNGADSSATANIKSPADKGGTGVTGLSPQNKEASDPLHPVVVLETSLGKVMLTLNAEKAPITAKNFLSYVNASFYNQTIIHQVHRDDVVVAGGYGMNLAEKPAHMAIRNEAENGLKNLRGTVAMARSPDAIDSSTSQFFFNVADNPSLDFREKTPDGYGYCVFGEVTEGMDIVNKMASAEVHNTRELERTPVKPIVITSARQVR